MTACNAKDGTKETLRRRRKIIFVRRISGRSLVYHDDRGTKSKGSFRLSRQKRRERRETEREIGKTPARKEIVRFYVLYLPLRTLSGTWEGNKRESGRRWKESSFETGFDSTAQRRQKRRRRRTKDERRKEEDTRGRPRSRPGRAASTTQLSCRHSFSSINHLRTYHSVCLFRENNSAPKTTDNFKIRPRRSIFTLCAHTATDAADVRIPYLLGTVTQNILNNIGVVFALVVRDIP